MPYNCLQHFKKPVAALALLALLAPCGSAGAVSAANLIEDYRERLAATGVSKWLAPQNFSTAAGEEDGAVREMRSGEVYVTAGKVERELLEVPMSVSVITEEQIRKSTSGTVGDLLRDVPGVELVNSGGQGYNRVSLRGEGPLRTLVLIDGQKIAENKSMEGPPLLIDPSVIERIEVIRGPASVLYGSEAIGGVINVITKKGGSEAIEGVAKVFYEGANDGYGGSVAAFGNINGFNYRVSASHGEHGDRHTPGGRMTNSNYRQTDAGVFLSYDFLDKFTVGANYDYFDNAVYAASMESGYEDIRINVPEWRREKFGFFAEAKDLTEWLPRLRLDVFTQENHKLFHNQMTSTMSSNADNTNDQFGISVQADWMIGENHYLITGYEFNRDKLDADSKTGGWVTMGPPGTPPVNMLMTNYTNDAKQNTHALYAQMESKLPMDFSLNYGVRYTWIKGEGERRDKPTTMAPNRYTTTKYDDSSNSKAVFNLGLIWSGIKDLALRATFSQGFRAPNLQEMYVTTSMMSETIQPNQDLDPETSNTYELGARYVSGGITLDATLFYTDADDYITSPYLPGSTTTRRYINVSKAKTHGAELIVSYELPYGFTPYLSGTWMKREFDYGSWSTWKTGSPELSGRLGLRYDTALTPQVDLHTDLYARMYSSTKSQSSKGGEVTKQKSWQTLNLAAGVDFGDKKQYSVNAEVLNIFNREYRYVDAILEPGTSFNMNFSVRF